ncbi:MAG: phosphoenolpyruvate--protein phosphotransferase [Alphaproteobacteria bacterium]|nr:phosphoenolpyruvate--protein phosphotransferase [Alphaproteobacteria bacterium]
MKTERGKRAGERIFAGVIGAAGVAIGPAHVCEAGALQVPEYSVARNKTDAEVERFRTALQRSQRQLTKLKTKSQALRDAAAEEIGYLLDAHLLMLTGSRLVRGVENTIATKRINAEAAVLSVISEVARGFESLPDPYMAARADDVREVGARLIRNLTETPFQGFSHLQPGTIIIAEELSPADAALIDPDTVAAFATVLGGAEGHTAIMARSFGIPAVFGVAGLLGGVKSGETVIVDGTSGRVVVAPTDPTIKEYEARREALVRERRQLDRLISVPPETVDGTPIGLQANLELPREVDSALAMGAEGIGLLRTEFMFMNRDAPPDEDEQYESLAALVAAMGGRPITVRTLDVGGEKLAYSLGEHLGMSVNPALGLRAIRLSLKQRKLFEAQLAAILRAGAHGPLRILLPLIASTGEVRQVREILARVVRRLKKRKVAIADPLPPLGVMIEVPGAALAADALAAHADFFAIGTNDLTMYTLAIDRADEQVAHLYNPLHPGVLRLIQFAVQAGMRARIPVSVCGEMAGDPRYTALLLGLGVRDLSMASPCLARVKQRIRQIDVAAASMRAEMIMSQADSGRIAALLDDFNALA